jgi:hypothetical protein
MSTRVSGSSCCVGISAFSTSRRDDGDAAPDGRLQLQPDEVVRISEAPLAISSDGRQPRRADQREKYVTLGEGGVDDVDEETARTDGLDIHEHAVVAHEFGEAVIQATCVPRRIFPSVADENTQEPNGPAVFSCHRCPSERRDTIIRPAPEQAGVFVTACRRHSERAESPFASTSRRVRELGNPSRIWGPTPLVAAPAAVNDADA